MSNKTILSKLKHQSEYNEEAVETLDLLKSELLKISQYVLDEGDYLPSSESYNGNTSFMTGASEDFKKKIALLAKFEYGYVKAVLTGSDKILCLIGPAGSGKTTTINYLYPNFIQTDLRIHCNKSGCRKKRSLIIVDFNTDDLKGLGTQEKAYKRLIKKVSEHLETAIYGLNGDAVLVPDSDLYGFWDWVVDQIKHERLKNSPGLKYLKSLFITDLSNINSIEFKKQTIKKIKSDKSRKLDYLFLVLHYMNNVVYNPEKKCVQLIFDNIDYSDPYVQEELSKLIDTRMKAYNFHVCVSLRQETFMRSRMNTTTFEYKLHEGPLPSKLLLKKCVDFRNTYQNAKNLQAKYSFQTENFSVNVFSHIKRIISVLENGDPYNVLTQFIDNSMRNLLRSMILASQYLFNNRSDFIAKGLLTDHHLLRVLLRYDLDYFKNDPNSPICNLFYCRVGHHYFPLVKLFILQFLYNLPESESFKCTRISVIIEHLESFGHNEAEVLEAINDLLSPYHQLIFSDFKDNYITIDEVTKSSKIYLTKAGTNYLLKISNSLDYISEMILTCTIDDKSLEKIRDSNFVIERIHVVIRYLVKLNEIDAFSIRNFIDKKGIEEYNLIYDDLMITMSITLSIWEQLTRIRNAVIKQNPDLSYDFHELITDYKNTFILNYNSNSEINKFRSIDYSKENGMILNKIEKEVNEMLKQS